MQEAKLVIYQGATMYQTATDAAATSSPIHNINTPVGWARHQKLRITTMPVSIVQTSVVLAVRVLPITHVICVRESQLVGDKEMVGPVEDALLLAVIQHALHAAPASSQPTQ